MRTTSQFLTRSLFTVALLAGLGATFSQPQFNQVAHAAKGGQPDYQTQINALQAQIDALTAQLDAESAKLADVSVDPVTGDLYVTGINLHVQSGSGATDGLINGAGNLIIGYNEDALGPGSHNLVIGPGHTYSSYGGVVAGAFNQITAPFANVTGGAKNTASGVTSSISGGTGNFASGTSSHISAGRFNTASGVNSSVGGGSDNVASGFASTIPGGLENVSTLDYGLGPDPKVTP
jgi:hypothetical protein